MQKRQAYYLINQPHMNENWHDGTGSAWDYDGRGAQKKQIDRGPYSITNISGEYPTALIREMQTAREGVFTLETSATFYDGFDGFILSLYDADENDMMRIETRDGAFVALGAGNEYVTLLCPENKQTLHFFNITLDFDDETITYYIDNLWCATLPMLAKSFKYLKIGTLEGHKVAVEPTGAIDLYANFPLHDSFLHYPCGTVPFMWKTEGDVAVNAKDELVLKADSSAYKKFDAQSGKLILETYHFNYLNGGETALSLMHGKDELFGICVKDGAIFLNGSKARHFLDEMWYRLRFELDTKAGIGKFSVNNKEKIEFSFESKSIDGILYTSKNGAELRVDNITMQNVIEYSDYCPKPIPPKDYGKYQIGMNICSLWRTGHHIGWDCITPFNEVKPYLGYYDEGIVEVADWEIKFMVENGVTAQFFCWYLGEFRDGPIKKTRESAALVDGFMNAKYSEMMNFGLLFEAATAPASLESFKKYIVPYWIENFFTDKRYIVIDNKPIICFYALPSIIRSFGSEEAVKEGIMFLKSEVKKLGFDDCIVFTNVPISEQVIACGVDAAYVYGWSRQGESGKYQIEQHKLRKNVEDMMYFIPTASVGFNRCPWDTERSGLIKLDEFEELLTYFRDEYLPTIKRKDKWMQNFLMLSNWNEYGEGTYISPTNLHGFGYLEKVRDVFTGGTPEGESTNFKPTANQLKRLSTLYPQERKMLRCLDIEPTSKNITELPEEGLILDMHPSKNCWYVEEFERNDDGNEIYGISTGSDAKFTYTGELGFDCTEANCLVIELEAEVSDNLVVYYTTTDSPNWCAANKAVISIFAGKHKYNVPLGTGTRRIRPLADQDGTSKTYTGKVTGLRIDPSNSIGVKSKLISCKLYNCNIGTPTGHLYIDGDDLILDNDYVTDGKHYMVPIFPERCIIYRLNGFYKYNAQKKHLAIYANHRSVEFDIGTRKAWINGEVIQLDCVPYFYNGLPMVPFDVICNALNYKFEYKNANIYVTTTQD